MRQLPELAVGVAIRVVEVQLDDWALHDPQRIGDRDRGVRVCRRIDDNPLDLQVRLLDPVDQLGLRIRLAKIDREAEGLGALSDRGLDFRQRRSSVKLGLANPRPNSAAASANFA